MAAVAVEADKELLDRIKGHLALLGYSMSDTPTEHNPLMAVGLHSRRPRLAIRPYKTGILITALYKTTDQTARDEQGFFKFINEQNVRSTIARFYWYAPIKALVAEMWFAGAYDATLFGLLFDEWTYDINESFEAQKRAGSKYFQEAAL